MNIKMYKVLTLLLILALSVSGKLMTGQVKSFRGVPLDKVPIILDGHKMTQTDKAGNY